MMGLERSFWLVIALIILQLTNSTKASGDAEWALAQETGRSSNQSLLWGPYRSNLYFGIRPRIPKSLLAGLLWTKVDDYATVQNSTSGRRTGPGMLGVCLDWSSIPQRILMLMRPCS